MSIKDRINNIKEYFKEMQVVTIEGEQIIYVIVEFPNGWIIESDIEEKFDVVVERGETPTEYYFSADIETGEHIIFDAIDYNITKMKAAIERAQLLRQKTIELKEIFEDENVSLDELRNLTFVYKATSSEIPSSIEAKIDPLITIKNEISTPKRKKGHSGSFHSESAEDFGKVEVNNKEIITAN